MTTCSRGNKESRCRNYVVDLHIVAINQCKYLNNTRIANEIGKQFYLCMCVCVWRRAANYAERKSKMLFQKLARNHGVISARWNVKLAVIKVKYLPNKSWYAIRCVFRVCQFRIFIGFIRFVSVTLCLFVRQINASRRQKCKQECGNHSICHSHHTSTQSTNSNWTTRVCRMLLTWWTFDSSHSLSIVYSSFVWCTAHTIKPKQMYEFNLIWNCRKKK